MRRRLLDLLACPECGGAPLRLEAARESGGEIAEGTLRCGGCGKTYPVVRGVPRFCGEAASTEERRTLETFGQQWKQYAWLSPEYEQQFLGWICPVEPSFFKDKVVLDGGCGKGRHLFYASRYGARDVVGLDASEAVEAAHANLREHENVHVVQGDLRRPPLRPVFDYVYSVGVLHHLPNPSEGFRALVRLVRSGGRITAWVYGREGNAWVRATVWLSQKTLARMPRRAAYAAAAPLSLAVFGLVKGIYGPLHRAVPSLAARLPYHAYFTSVSGLPFREIHLIVVDHLLPAIAHYIPKDEFARWFEEMRLADVRIEWHNRNSWRGHGLRQATV